LRLPKLTLGGIREDAGDNLEDAVGEWDRCGIEYNLSGEGDRCGTAKYLSGERDGDGSGTE